MQRTLIIVPTYNERANVDRAAREFLAPLPDAELLFVDDDSPDGTPEILDRIATGDERVHVLHRGPKSGLGAAYRAGFRWALERDYDYVVEMDADFSHDPSYLPGLVEAAASGADMAVGSRYAPGGGTENWGWTRRTLSRLGCAYARTVLGVGVRDLTAGFVCYRRETLERLPLDEVRTTGYGFQIEMKYRVLRAGMRIVELPIVFVERRAGQSKMTAGIALEAITLCWRLRFR